MRYELRLSRAARRALTETLPEQVAVAVWEFLDGPLRDNPRRVGKALRFQLAGFYAARRGQYRVIYRIDDSTVVVEVVRISHRGDAYL